MSIHIKQAFHQFLSKVGYRLERKDAEHEVRLPLWKANSLVEGFEGTPVVFDVGANIGQTISVARQLFPGAEIFSFEPGEKTFATLKENFEGIEGVHLFNCAVGSTEGRIQLHENSEPTMSSVLEQGSEGWGSVQRVSEVELTTVDAICKTHGVDHISILKSDTQGYDFEVLRGASEMMDARRVDCVCFEMLFTELYKGTPRFDRVLAYMLDKRFAFAGMFNIHNRKGVAAWADVLFVRQECLSKH